MDINANLFNQLAAMHESYMNSKSFNAPRNSISANNYVNQATNNNNLHLDLEDLSDKQAKKEFNSNSNNTNQQESFKISNHFYLNENSTSVNINNNELKLDLKEASLDKRAISSKKNIRKESMPNLTFHDKKEFSQFIPYIMKRKFSVGQIKVR